MTKLIDAIRTNDARTENGMVAHSTTLNYCVDMFSQIGALRGKDMGETINMFSKAYGEDPLTATRLLFWARDVRGGSGERKVFRDIIHYMTKSDKKEVLRKNLSLISEYGRWDDLLVLVGTPLEKDALDLIGAALKDGNGLCAKWMPRPNVGNREKKRFASVLRKHLGLDPKAYRKMLVEHTNVVEQLMCAKQFDKINYEHVPSKAMSDYMKAFGKNDYAGFTNYLNSIEKGDAKINASAIYPYDVIKNLRSGNGRGANLQWEALPNYLEGSNERIMPMVDVSGSMYWPESKISGDLYAGHVAQSMGLYVSQRNVGPFKDAVMQFNTTPELCVLKGDLTDRYNQLQRIGVGGSTNIEAAFKVILDAGKRHGVPADEMPTMILIFSDMQFNSCVQKSSDTAMEMIKRMYSDAGYKVPQVVFWQLNARAGNQPVQAHNSGCALVSGFSPAILSTLLGGKDMSPVSIMNDLVNSERYAKITI